MELLILAFDHRGSFLEKMFGIKGREPTQEETKTICDYKKMIYEGFVQSVKGKKEGRGILVDEQFGSGILEDAKKNGITFAMPCEKSGQDEFDFDYGSAFPVHIQKFNPEYVKVLVRFNPEGNDEVNLRQMEKLKKLDNYLKLSGRKLLFELLVPATEKQMAGGKEKYDAELRPKLMVRTMKMIQDYAIEPDIWKLEGVDKSEDSRGLVAQAKAGGRNAWVVTLGRGESREKVAEWLKVGAKIPGIIGFAVGRTIFWEPLEGYKNGRFSRSDAVRMIGDNYSGFVKLWQDEKNGQ
ncbi:MAG: DUF2090 domain-containing protein [Candidatus Aenigmarchaeota archaeon]|nr:DUF2090 domain-containing protein [Candidatus Aenigmarchaeota archaeon]